MSGRHAVRAALVALALALLFTAQAGTADAAQVTLQPSPAEARTFATTNGGWSSAVDYNGLVCIPGVTCPTANPTYQTTGGAGGAGDGFLRDSFGTLLGVLSTTTINWTSPSFVAPANVDSASLSVDVRPQIASLLAIGSVRLRMRVIDVADGTRSTTVADVPLTAASASFTPVSANVPAGALVTGRSYRVELGVALTTSVSAVTSGNVDLDNVVLRITDLEPPSGLTGSFQTTGAPRVDGSVDPLGQDTSVTVEYGTTVAYGNSTSPVLVRGTGAQAFSIPLGSLTPGTRYHYRLVAQNADGTTTTSDQSFIAPSPPANTPPVVSGPGNSRDRTVTFTRPGDVVRATVEVLDGSRSVVATYDDADADGVVTITLPDADGTYGVRVVRENAESQTSTSAEVPAVLDRIAPSTGAVDLRVTPALSNDPQRTVTFTPPGDAISATAQVLDRSGRAVGPAVAAVGGTATVQLSAGEGDYTVRLTLNDAAGNAATVDSGTVTLDTTGPSGGGAPLVTGDGNRRDRSVRFERDPSTTTATIEVLDRDGRVVATSGVAFGDSGTVTLPDADGDYTVRVRQSDGAGNSALSAGTPVVLDRVGPSAGSAPTVTGAGNSRDREVSFTRDPSTVTATIEVLDGVGSVVATVPVPTGTSATVTLPDADGTYSVRVRQTDAATNSATSPTADAVLDRVAPSTAGVDLRVAPALSNDTQRSVTLTPPGDATSATAQVLDRSGNPVGPAVGALGGTATVALSAGDGDYTVRITLRDAAGNTATVDSATVTLDTAAPSGGPAPGVTGDGNRRDREVRFDRDPTTTTATIEVLDSDGRIVASTSVPSGDSGTVTLPDADGDYTIRVRQSDGAGNSGTSGSTPVTLDRVGPDAGPAPTVTGQGNRLAREVRFTRDPSTVSATIEVLDGNGIVVATTAVPTGAAGTVTLPDGDGTYRIRVRQVDAATNSATSPEAETTLDRVAPDPGPAPTVDGDLSRRDRTVSFTRDPTTVSAVVEILRGGVVVQSVPVVSGSSQAIQLPVGDGTYDVRVRQTDEAGNSAASPTTEVSLDQAGPAASDPPTVTGAGNSRVRAVAFTRPGDAVTAVIELLDAEGTVIDTIPVSSGSSGVVRLPDAARDGRYGVQVTLTDALGNSATTPITAFALDTSPPDAGPAPTVTGPPDALSVSFTRAPDAATAVIEVLDGSGNVIATVPVAAGASSATVDLPDAPGGYGIRVVQTDAAGNSATTPVTAVVRNAPEDRRPTDDRRPGDGRTGGDGRPGGDGGRGGNGDGALPLTDPGRYGTLLQQCFGGDVVLTDVTAQGARVSVKGLSRYAPGSTVTIVDLAGRRAGSTRIGATGRFAVVVRAPSSARARLAVGYRAVVGTRRSPVVRLRRANVLTGVAVRGATIQIRGRVDVARLGSLRRIRVFGGAGATACKRSRQLQIVGRVAVDRRTGRYSLRARAPSGSGRLVVRTQAFGSKLASRSSFAVK